MGTIASLSFTLYRAFKKVPGIEPFVVIMDTENTEKREYKNDDHVMVLSQSKNKSLIGHLKNRIKQVKILRCLKKDLHINLSVSTLLGCNVWNVLSKGEDICIGLFHTRLSQRKYDGRISYLLSLFAYKFILCRLDAFFAVCMNARDDLRHFFPNADIQLVYNIHDISNVKYLSQEPIVEEKIIFAKPVILFVGSLYRYIKAPDRLLRAFAIAKKKLPTDCNLVFIGSDPENCINQLLMQVKKEGCEDNVFFLGRKNNPYKYMRACSLLVSPSRDEGLPGVLIESLILGKKVVATNSSTGVWEIMQCEQNYRKDLSEIYETKFGLITPNNLQNEDFTIQKLAEAIVLCYQKNFPCIKSFDEERFSEQFIISKYLQYLR